MRELIAVNRVLIAKADQCMYGLQTIGDKGEPGPARKRTGFVSSNWPVVEDIDGTCSGEHDKHNHILGGRATHANVYPPALCQAMCRGIARQKLLDQRELQQWGDE